MQMIHGLTQNCKTLREVLIIKRKRSTKHHILESGYCFFLSSPICVSRCFFPCKPVKEGRLQRWRSLPVIFMFFMFHFWRAVHFFFFVRNARVCLAHHCQFCPEFMGMGTGVEGGLFLYPIPFIFSITRKKKITFCPVLKKDLDNLIFFFNTSV